MCKVLQSPIQTQEINEAIVIMPKSEYLALKHKAETPPPMPFIDDIETPVKQMKVISEIFTTYYTTEDYQIRIQGDTSTHESDVKNLLQGLTLLIQ